MMLLVTLTNILAIRSFAQEATFDEYTRTLNEILLNGLQHQSLPFGVLLTNCLGNRISQ
jgi:hypothetical protein